MNRRVDWFGYGGFFLLAAAVLIRLLFVDSGPTALGLAGLGLSLLLIYFFRAGKEVQGFLRRRSTRAGGSVFGVTLFVVGILVLVNILAVNIRARVDVTADKLFTLAPETVAALREAPDPPEVWVFYPEAAPVRMQMESILQAARLAEPRLTYHLVDPGRDPLEAARFDLRQFATVVEVGDRREIFVGDREEDFLAALVKTYRNERPRIGFLEGHGEASVTDRGEDGVRLGAESLGRRGYAINNIDLSRDGSIPGEVGVVVVAGPQHEFLPAETESLLAYMDRGGSLLVLLDPANPVTLDSLLGRVGIRFIPRFLLDPDQRDPQIIHPPEYSAHPVVRALGDRGVRVVLPGAGELEVQPDSPDSRRAALMRSGRRAVLAGDSDSEPRSRAVIAGAEWKSAGEHPGRMVVVGDGDFPRNRLFDVLGNGDLFLNAIQWLAEEDVLIDIRPRNRTSRPVVLSRQQGRALMVLITGLIPLGVLIAGTVVWWRRR